mmetsp:Transcript_13189/g.35944  ORF Transcript_13189/g.35944 Transcript_13189/m.35944 type:complete len:97 (-) Transcript_13189:8-298(-)
MRPLGSSATKSSHQRLWAPGVAKDSGEDALLAGAGDHADEGDPSKDTAVLSCCGSLPPPQPRPPPRQYKPEVPLGGPGLRRICMLMCWMDGGDRFP